MHTRQFGIATAIALLTVTPAAAQQPVDSVKTEKAPQSDPKQQARLSTPESPVQLAEREDAEQLTAPKRRPAARVTTCRCGDPAPQ